MKKYQPGVLFGEELEALYEDAKQNEFALPAVNTIGTNTINATLETAEVKDDDDDDDEGEDDVK